jgi:hypothetical protein
MDIDDCIPICLFVYNRLIETKRTVSALKNNYLAPQSELFIFSDGSKNEYDKEKVDTVRQYIKTISGFKRVSIFEAPVNKGLANSVISGVTQIVGRCDSVIVIEDDLVTSPNFLDFMNQALSFYRDNLKIHSVAGYTLELPSLINYPTDYYLGHRASSWGWGTWKNRWETVDWDVKAFQKFKNDPFQRIKFLRGGSDMFHMLNNQVKGKIDSWAIRWCFNQFQNDQLAIFPAKSKVRNIGFDINATHTKMGGSQFYVNLDTGNQREFSFDNDISIEKKIIKEFRSKYSLMTRLSNKLVNIGI